MSPKSLNLGTTLATGALSLIPSFALSYSYKTQVCVPILSVNWVNQLTGYKLNPMKWSNTESVKIRCFYVPKRMTPIVGARHSEHAFADAYCRR